MKRKRLRILVCMKAVRQLSSERGFDALKRTIDPDYLVRMVNPADEHALEMGLRLKEQIEQRSGSSEIRGLSVAPADDEEILRHSLAMGADEAFRVWGEEFENLNAMAVAYLLSIAIKKIGGDLILCGNSSSDTNGNEVGGYLAEFLHFPHVSEVTSIELSKQADKVVCRKRVERLGWDLVEASLPAVLAVEPGEIEPRYPNLYSILDWLGKEIKVLDHASLGIDPEQLEKWNSLVRFAEWSSPKPKKIFTPKSELPPEERMRLVFTGGVEKKKTTYIQGEVKEIVSQMIELMKMQKFLKTDRKGTDKSS